MSQSTESTSDKTPRSRTADRLLTIASVLLIGLGGALYFREELRETTFVRCRASNPGMVLRPEDGKVFVHPAGEPEAVVAVGELEDSIAIPPGTYDVRVQLVHAIDDHAAWVRGVTIRKGEPAELSVDFSAGELSVESTMGAKADSGQVILYVHAADDQSLIGSFAAGGIALIASGTYDVRAVLSELGQERDVRWLRGLEVEAGLHTRSEVHFRRGALLVRASNAGEPLPIGAVSMTLFAAGDQQREVIDSGLAGVPLGLPEGTYDVELTFLGSQDRSTRWLPGLVVSADETHEAVAEFRSGAVELRVQMAGGHPLEEFAAYSYFYPAGNHRQALFYVPSGERALLQEGVYDVRVSYLRAHDQPDEWVRGLRVAAGKTEVRAITFSSGRLLTRAYDGSGVELVGDDVFVFVYSVGERERPIARARSGEIMVLSAGSYDVRAVDTRASDLEQWVPGVSLEAGELVEKRVEFRGSLDPGAASPLPAR